VDELSGQGDRPAGARRARLLRPHPVLSGKIERVGDFLKLEPGDRAYLLGSMTALECAQLFHDWEFWARSDQAQSDEILDRPGQELAQLAEQQAFGLITGEPSPSPGLFLAGPDGVLRRRPVRVRHLAPAWESWRKARCERQARLDGRGEKKRSFGERKELGGGRSSRTCLTMPLAASKRKLLFVFCSIQPRSGAF
jgi:hypothetical protein